MENTLNNPGLQDIAENIFLNLNYETLEVCQQINKNSKHILENPMFWLKKFIRRGLSKKNQMDWIEVIRITRESEPEPLFGIRVVQKYGPRYVMLLHTSLDQQGPASSDFLSLDYLYYSTSGS